MVIIVVSNDEIKRRLAEKRNPSIKKNLTADGTVSSEELKKKFREKRNIKSKNSGYLICDNCGGYYELEPGEAPDDFSDECECGGKLEYTKTVNGS